jgi:hypothetical protein
MYYLRVAKLAGNRVVKYIKSYEKIKCFVIIDFCIYYSQRDV